MYEYLFVFLLNFIVINSIVLDRNLLASWYPDYETRGDLPLDNRNITSIALDTFQNLTNIQSLDLSVNNLNDLYDFTFKDLINVEQLYLKTNNISNLKLVYF